MDIKILCPYPHFNVSFVERLSLIQSVATVIGSYDRGVQGAYHHPRPPEQIPDEDAAFHRMSWHLWWPARSPCRPPPPPSDGERQSAGSWNSPQWSWSSQSNHHRFARCINTVQSQNHQHHTHPSRTAHESWTAAAWSFQGLAMSLQQKQWKMQWAQISASSLARGYYHIMCWKCWKV